MITKTLQEKIDKRSSELREIRRKIAGLEEQRDEAVQSGKDALVERDPGGIVSARQTAAKLDEDIQALKSIEAEIVKVGPVTEEEFVTEFRTFKNAQKALLDGKYDEIVKTLESIKPLLSDYTAAYQDHLGQLAPWNRLAGSIGMYEPIPLTTAKHELFPALEGTIKEFARRASW